MKKTFILAFFMMFCSMVFGQNHWTTNSYLYENTMSMQVGLTISGEEIAADNYEIAAFYDGNVVGNGMFEEINGRYQTSLFVYGPQNGAPIQFKLYDHESQRELGLPSEEIAFVIDGNIGTILNPRMINFSAAAKIGDIYYATLQEAVDACSTGDNTIVILKNLDEDVTVKQVEGVNVIIDGGETTRFDYSGTITIHGQSRFDKTETLTIKNIYFTTEEAGHYFIDSNDANNGTKRYAHNVTVEDCNFAATGAGVNSAAAMRIRQGFNIAIVNSEFTGLHSALQAYGNAGIAITGITVNNCKNGISVGTSTGVVITNSAITATGYGVRADGEGAYDMTLAGNTIEANLPVVVRKATGAYELTVGEGNSFTASNEKGAAVVFTTGDDGTFLAPTSDAIVTIEGDVTTFGFEAKVGNVYYTTLAKAFAAANSGDTLTFLCDVAGAGLAISKDITVDMGGFNYTINQAVGSTGTESQGFQLLPAAKNVTIQNGNISVAEGTNVVWMFNDYAENLTVKDVTIDCENMVWSKSVYLIVANNQHGTNPCPVFDNVTIENYSAERSHALIENNTQLTAQAGLNVVTDPGYSVKYVDGTYKVVANMVKVLNGDTEVGTYATLAEAIAAATAGNTIQFLADITENVTISKNVTIYGAGKTYTGKMSVTSDKGKVNIKNVNFDGKGYNGYAIETRGVYYVTIEDCTAKNYGYGFVQQASATVLTTVKNVTVSDMNYGIKVDYGTDVVLENVDVTAGVAALLNSNYGEKTITVKDSKLNILGTWTRNNTVKTTYVFEGANTVGKWVIDAAIDSFKLATKESTLTAPNEVAVTTDVEGYSVKYADGKYYVAANMVAIGEETYASIAEAHAAAKAGDILTFLADITEDVTISKNVTIDGAGKTYTGKMIVTSDKGTVNIKNVNFDGKGYNGYAIEARGVYYLTIEDCTAKNYGYGFLQNASGTVLTTVKNVTITDMNYGVKVDYSNAVVLENVDITAGVAALLNSNYGEKTITIKDSKLNILGTWTRNNTIKTTYSFEGANTVGEWVIDAAIDNFKLATKESTLTAPNEVAVTTDVEGYGVKYVDGTYKVVANNVKVLDGETEVGTYATLSEAITAASAGNTIQFLADLTEDVLIQKDLTIDGAGKNYTGNISVKGSTVDVIVKNVNFINGTGYAITTNTTKSITVENCTVNNYGYGFLYANKSTPTVVVKDVEVNNANYGMHYVYGSKATLENVTMTNVAYGLYIQNYAAKTITVKNSDITSIEVWERKGYSAVQTFKFEGENVVGALDNGQYAKYVLTAIDATLTAPAGFNVVSGVADYIVAYEGGVYKLVPGSIWNKTQDKKYGTLQAAIDAAVTGDEIVLLADINLDNTELGLLDGAYNTYFKVEGKTVTIDLNGMEISGTFNATPMLVGVFSTENNGHLTLVDNSEGQDALVSLTSGNDQVYSLLANYEDGSSITINGGTYNLDKALDSHMYTGGDEGIVVNGGNFNLGNVGSGTNGQPWMFNGYGKNQNNVIVNGGTFTADVNHQFWANEVYVPETLALQNNGDGTWTVVESVAYVNEIGKSTGSKERKVGYASLADAVKSTGATVTVIKDHETKAPAIVEKDFTIDMNGMAVTAAEDVYPVIRVQNGANVTVTGEGSIENATDYVFVLGSSDQTSAGNLTIENGTFTGMTTVASVTKGLLTINGGEFKVKDGEYGSTYLINCYDANYKDGSAKVAICGGTFYGFNPESNAAEGANTNFCAVGYNAVETGADIWTVVPKQVQSIAAGWTWFSSYMSEFNGETGLAMLQEQLGENGIEIKNHHDGTSRYEAGYGWYGALKSVNTNSMYMINVSEEQPIEIGGAPVTSSTITLKPGWNAIGFPSTESINVADVFAQVQNNDEDLIKSKDQYVGYAGGCWDDGSLQSMEPGKGYMYYNSGTTDQVLVFPIAKSRGDVKANATTANNYWVANGAAFANNMTMTAVLNVNGVEMTDNYEVAAFAGEEVRGSARPVYVESIDRYVMFMTIYGEGNEELTFKYIDLDTYEVHNLNDMVVYADNAMLGSLRKPIELCYGTMGIGENGFDTMSLYPNPTRTGRTISLEAICDMVEVFNSLGVKVAEYRNVETIDGIEEAGVYVIRVTNDSTVQNCRLIVK